MSDRKMIPGLHHKHAGIGDDVFFAEIDAAGGWPVGFRFVGFEHTEKRAAGFTNSADNNGYWTVVACADDYYLWKLSPAALQRIADAVRDAITLPAIKAEKLWIRTWGGHRAALGK